MADLKTRSIASWTRFILFFLLIGTLTSCSKPVPKKVAAAKSRTVDAKELFDKMCTVYREANQYIDNSTIAAYTVSRAKGVEQIVPQQHLSIAFKRPNKLRVDYSTVKGIADEYLLYSIACNGEVIRSSANEVPTQIHETIAPKLLTAENFCPEPNLRTDLLKFSVENLLPQLAMLLSDGDNQSVLPMDKLDRVLEDGKIKGESYHRIQTTSPAGIRVLWIDSEDYSLRRVELPIDRMPEFADVRKQFLKYSVCIDFEGILFDSDIDDSLFELEIPADGRRVRRFIAPPPPAPADGNSKDLEQHRLLVRQYEQALESATIKDKILDIEIKLPEVADKQLPTEFKVSQLWQTPGQELNRVDDVMVLPGESESDSRILVLDGGKEIVEVDLKGQVLGRHAIPEHTEVEAGFLRATQDGQGRIWYLASGTGWQQAHVLDEAWEHVISFPKGNHSGIGDVYFADLTGSGEPLMHVGYRGGLGVQGSTLEGQRVWTNRDLDYVVSVAAGPKTEKGKKTLWCTSTRGTALELSEAGRTTQEIAVLTKALLHAAHNPDEDSHAGLAVEDLGQYSAVGFTSRGKLLWEYEFPKGEYARQVQQIQYVDMPKFGKCWMFAAPNGTLYWFDASGKLIDSFSCGQLLSGIAFQRLADQALLILGTPSELTAWAIEASD